MKFEVDDEQYDPQGGVPPIVTKVLDVVRSMPDGKLYTIRRLAQEVGYALDTVHNCANYAVLNEYKILAKGRGTRRSLFGNAETIRAYQEEIKNE